MAIDKNQTYLGYDDSYECSWESKLEPKKLVVKSLIEELRRLTYDKNHLLACLDKKSNELIALSGSLIDDIKRHTSNQTKQVKSSEHLMDMLGSLGKDKKYPLYISNQERLEWDKHQLKLLKDILKYAKNKLKNK